MNSNRGYYSKYDLVAAVIIYIPSSTYTNNTYVFFLFILAALHLVQVFHYPQMAFHYINICGPETLAVMSAALLLRRLHRPLKIPHRKTI